MPKIALHWQILIAMILAAVIGAVLNRTAGMHTFQDADTKNGREIPATQYELAGDKKVSIPKSRLWIETTPSHTLIQLEPLNNQVKDPKTEPERWVVSADLENAKHAKYEWPKLTSPDGQPIDLEPIYIGSIGTLESDHPVAYATYQTYGRSTAMKVADFSKKIGNLFLRMLQMVSVPLIITSLISGILGLGKAERLGRMFSRTLAYYLSTSLLAITTGLLVFNIMQPGAQQKADGIKAVAAAAKEDEAKGKESPPIVQGKSLATVLFAQVENMLPSNPIKAVADGEFLSIIAFSMAFGVCTILVGGHSAEWLSHLFQSAFEVMMTMTMLIIKLAPIGVFFLMLSATASQGLIIFGTLGAYMLTVAIALFVHAVIVLPLIVRFVGKRSPWQYAKAMSPALFTAFSSASSNGTLPLTMNCVEERAGISNRVGSFVLPLGATVNMDGTALYEAVAVMFIANMTPGVDLTLGQQIIVAFTALVASIGAAGIPHAGLVMMVIILQAVGLPLEQQGLILAVDRILDMGRTAVNVWSDSCGCAVVSRFEEE